MINAVSSVNFKANAPVDVISRPGAYTKPLLNVPEDKPKKSSFWRKLACVAATVVVAAGAILAGYKKGILKVLPDLEKATMKDKAGHYLAKAGEWLDKNCWSNIVALKSHFKAEKVEKAAEAAEAAVA